MRWAREVWARKHFDKMCMQFLVKTAVDLLCAIRACMGKDYSIVYVGFNFGVNHMYTVIVASFPNIPVTCIPIM